MQTAVIGLGANLGQRLQTLESAIHTLAHSAHIRVVRVSPVYETEAVGPPQPNFLNAAVRIETDLEPEALLDTLLAIEMAHGRIRKERWGPRTLDLDILAICEPETHFPVKIATPRLTVPHPRLFERSFALAPLLDVMPELDVHWGALLRALGGAPNQIPNHWDFGTLVG
jgi:2-amino-4-hydroxy-6-hydroxymethyldihydropteridine diphosphokinase